MHKPITPKLHGILDYGFATAFLLAPTMLKLKGPAKKLCYGYAANTVAFNGLSDHPVAIRRTFSLNPMHKRLDLLNLASLFILPHVTGAAKNPKARAFFAGILVAGIVNVLLTDYNGDTDE